uniref:RRM domain-containing protein n=1 Tax=Meloidogyne enterolobii TaxID=390850 RepID=A0A6V7XQX8_MELEN|nr:unnamed protein product [Meloidogyne enterolobii]
MQPASLYNQQLNAATLSDQAILQATLAAQQATAITNSAYSSSNGDSSSPPTGSRDTRFTKIFVGGLPYHTTDESLNNYFSQFGEIEEVCCSNNRQANTKSRGYGFVTMKERAQAEKACRDPNPIIDGRKTNVNLAYLGAKPRNNSHLAVLSQTLGQLPQLQAVQLQAALQLQQQQQRLAASVLSAAAASPTSQLLLSQNPTTAAAIAAAQQQAAQQQLAAINPLAAIQFSQNISQQPQNTAALVALAAQQAALLQQQQQANVAVTSGANTANSAYFDYNQLLLAAAQQQQSGNQQTSLAAVAAAYGMPVGSGTPQFDYSNSASLAAAYPFLQQVNTLSATAPTSVTNSQSYVAQLAAQAQLAAAVSNGGVAGTGSTTTTNNLKRSSKNLDQRRSE